MSLTIIGLIVAVLSAVLKGAGFEVGTEQLTNFVGVGGQIVGAAMIYIGRIRKGDLNLFGLRKQS